MMKPFIIAALIAGVPVFGSSRAFGDADDLSRIGQYFCVVEHVVGINSGKDQTYAGKVELPDRDKPVFHLPIGSDCVRCMCDIAFALTSAAVNGSLGHCPIARRGV
jgi:hypothetical protein